MGSPERPRDALTSMAASRRASGRAWGAERVYGTIKYGSNSQGNEGHIRIRIQFRIRIRIHIRQPGRAIPWGMQVRERRGERKATDI